MTDKPQTVHYSDTNALLAETSRVKPTDLSREIQVIGAGYSRTATVSFTLALEKLLKGPVCHAGSASLMREEAFIKSWISALDPNNTPLETQNKLKSILAGYVATTDSPSYMFAGELAAAYPNAKVIVTTRDPEKWWISFSELLKTVSPWWVPYVFWSEPTLRWFGKWADGMTKRSKIIYPPGTAPPKGPEFLATHHAYLRSVVPPERLFFFNVKDGWEPLCKILHVPIPDEPFPHANDKLAVQQAFMSLIKGAAIKWVEYLVVPAVVVGAYFFMTR